MNSPNRFKLATFGFSGQGGVTITAAPGTPDCDWAQQVRIAQLSDAANIEAVIAGARWIGYGGKTNFHGRSYDTFTWAAGIAATTQKTQIFATVHMPTIHPVRLAKMIATTDHIAGGRFGLNIVAGWFIDEIQMFGVDQRQHDDRYAFGDEFIDVVNQLLDREGFFDFDGKYFPLKRLYSEPKPLQAPRPVYMAAGVSPRGRQFAAQNADISFMVVENLATVGDMIADTKRQARECRRELMVFGQCPIVCADTEKEAREYLRYYVEEMGDVEAARNWMSNMFPQTLNSSGVKRQIPPGLEQHFLNQFIAGGGHPLLGTPEQVVDGFLARSKAGMDGATVTWVNYEEGLIQFREKILPLMIQAGLRVDEPAPVYATPQGPTSAAPAVVR